MVKVLINGTVIAESDKTTTADGNHYFPREALKQEYFKPSAKSLHTTCPWKGEASYWDIDVGDGKVLSDAAWYYPKAITDRAKDLEGRTAFYKNKVQIVE
ncbi:BZ3500_MvSof-1268-A1-R1_Chr5-3g08191 [Microbotryum saponariae]|uniref:BZ3500_MvSof-1268-A1-R1_Chr5-3g08191 protein n=1 Tax=Microbotryum saponariae TaxID=289078 RepID=A0A2X0LQW9_9BASI|nr:BZ3500_MvSof-1268-A1-R1_Chr5-3g08191 [Microbotryum saponariae]SDA07950.1 BZ3501_MvSof-1269-A2-R1_Chr5-1g07335 [Microbotryum saponariae]